MLFYSFQGHILPNAGPSGVALREEPLQMVCLMIPWDQKSPDAPTAEGMVSAREAEDKRPGILRGAAQW